MFTKARIKLTIFYLSIVIVIITIFSALLLYLTAQHIKDSFEDDSVAQSTKDKIYHEAIGQIRDSILVGDLIVILLAGTSSYWLAGKTLKPIYVALAAQEQFSANASHELRTPLAIMQTDLEGYLKNKQPTMAAARQAIASSLEEVAHLNAMIENLLALARSKQAEEKMESAEVDIAKIAGAVVRKLRPLAEAKKIELSLRIEDSLPVMGNEKLLEQLIFNLVQNALNYTDSGSVEVLLEAETDILIKIKDAGIGIDKQEIEKIFKPFYKIDSARSAKSGGVGLGLSIVKDIVEKHKGSIKVESELGQGTLVTVTLPAGNKKAKGFLYGPESKFLDHKKSS